MTDPDLLFPPDPRTRDVARDLFAHARELPLISPHGHVDPWLLADDRAFGDPARLLIVPDHYVTRMLLQPGRGPGRPRRARAATAAPVRDRRAGDLAAARRALAPVPGDPVAAVARADAGRGVRHPHAAAARRPPTRSTTRSPSAWPRPSSGRARCSSGSASRCSPPPSPPTDDLAAHAKLAADGWGGPAAGSSPRSGRTTWSTPSGPAGPTGWTGWASSPARTPSTYHGYPGRGRRRAGTRSGPPARAAPTTGTRPRAPST